MNPRLFESGGSSLADMEFKADQEETIIAKPIKDEAKLAQAVDEIFEPKTGQKTTKESLEASDAGFWIKEYYTKAKGDSLNVDIDKLESAAFTAQNYLTALVEQVNNPNVKIDRIQTTGEEAKMKQFARDIVAEWNREKIRQAQRAERKAGRLPKAA